MQKRRNGVAVMTRLDFIKVNIYYAALFPSKEIYLFAQKATARHEICESFWKLSCASRAQAVLLIFLKIMTNVCTPSLEHKLQTRRNAVPFDKLHHRTV